MQAGLVVAELYRSPLHVDDAGQVACLCRADVALADIDGLGRNFLRTRFSMIAPYGFWENTVEPSDDQRPAGCARGRQPGW